jgi:hypothetical protein
MLIIYLVSLAVCLLSMSTWFYFRHSNEPLTVGVLVGFLIVSLMPIVNVLVPICIIWNAFWKGFGNVWDYVFTSGWAERWFRRLEKFMDFVLIKPRR